MTQIFELTFTAKLTRLTDDEMTLEGEIDLKIKGEFKLADVDEIGMRICERFGRELAYKISDAKKEMRFLS